MEKQMINQITYQKTNLQGSASGSQDKSGKLDPSNSKYPRVARRQNGGNNSKFDGKKPFVPQKKTYYDKRSRQRAGSESNRPGSVASDPLDDWIGCDLTHGHEQPCDGSKKFPGSKKHNMNHLLNFSFTPRENPENRRFIGSNAYKYSGKQTKHSKEQFIQANCQFIVKNGHDYSVHSIDPDLPIEWNLIEEIRFNCLKNVFGEAACPICLNPPQAAKITRCGHIYCWSCILHYLSLSDNKYRKCPICYDAICKTDLKSVSSVPKTDYRIGDEMTFCLMKRKKGCIIPGFVTDEIYPESFSYLNENEMALYYHKLIVATASNVFSEIINRERNQLSKLMIEEKDTPEVCFIEQALLLLSEREFIVSESLTKEKEIKDTKVNSSEIINIPTQEKALSSSAQSNLHQEKDEELYYFYQSSDGQHIYLNPLNVKMLTKEYGALKFCPPLITAKIIDMDWATMSESLRRKWRYMQHIPLNCEFRIVEVELKHPIISRETENEFRQETLNRQRMRNKRAREEKRRDRHIRLEENKKHYGVYPRPKFQLDNLHQFPSCTDMDILRADSPVPSESSTISETETQEKNVTQSEFGTSPPNFEPEFPTSFAAMLLEGKSKPELKTPAKKSEIQGAEKMTQSDEECLAKPFSYSLSDAFEAALTLKNGNGNKKKKRRGKNN